MNAPFMKTFGALPPEDLQDAWLGAIKKELDKANIPQAKKDTMLQPYSTISTNQFRLLALTTLIRCI